MFQRLTTMYHNIISNEFFCTIKGLRFGDQILQINGETLAGYDREKVMKLIKKQPAERIELAVRDRPFERAITMQKDSAGHVGFIFKDGKITSIVKDSSAARNGLLIEHNLLEVNGQNMVGLKVSLLVLFLALHDCIVDTNKRQPYFIIFFANKRLLQNYSVQILGQNACDFFSFLLIPIFIITFCFYYRTRRSPRFCQKLNEA